MGEQVEERFAHPIRRGTQMRRTAPLSTGCGKPRAAETPADDPQSEHPVERLDDLVDLGGGCVMEEGQP